MLRNNYMYSSNLYTKKVTYHVFVYLHMFLTVCICYMYGIIYTFI